jgi:hypothetical protein
MAINVAMANNENGVLKISLRNENRNAVIIEWHQRNGIVKESWRRNVAKISWRKAMAQ